MGRRDSRLWIVYDLHDMIDARRRCAVPVPSLADGPHEAQTAGVKMQAG